MLLLSALILIIIVFYLGHQTGVITHQRRERVYELPIELDDCRINKGKVEQCTYDSKGNAKTQI